MAVHAIDSLARAALPAAPGSALLRARAWFARPRLDARVAAGERADGDRLLALRIAQLTSRRTRRRLADAIDHACERADERPAISAAVPVDHAALGVARPALEQLADALRSRHEVQPRGVALAQLLLTEPGSPLHTPASPDELYEAARGALFALGAEA
jgi:hypothetical protein